MRFYHNFWRLYDQWKRLVDLQCDEVCIICFEKTCSCSKVKVTKEIAFSIINYLMDINLQYSYNAGEGFIHENEGYDRDFIYPYYEDRTLVASFVRGKKHRNFADGGVYKNLFGDPGEEGVVWGKLISNVFVPLAKYDYPNWYWFDGSGFRVNENSYLSER